MSTRAAEPTWSEADRLAALARLAILDTPPEPDFDAIVGLAALLCSAPIALISLVSDTRQWFKAERGRGVRETPLDASVCARVLSERGVVVVPNLAADGRFDRNPLVTGEPYLRFYAGCVLRSPEGLPLGTLCVLDTVPRPEGLDERREAALAGLARQVTTLLVLRQARDVRRAEQARRDFLVGLSDRMRALSGPHDVMAEAAEALGCHLGADCAGYAEISATGEWAVVERDWTRASFATAVGSHRLAHFGPALAAELHAGRTVQVDDVATAPLTAGSADARATSRTRAFVNVPQIKDGRLDAVLFVLSGTPRAWSGDEVTLVEEVGECTRHAVARARAETARRERDEQFRTLADNISQLAWMTEADGSITWYNQRWYDYTGTTIEQMQGWGWQQVHHPDHLGRVVERFRAAIETGEPWEDTFPLRGKDGRYRWFLSRAVPIRDEDGRIARWFGTNTDVTEQREAEARLEARVAERTLELTQAISALHGEAVERQQAEAQLYQSQKMEAIGQLTGGIAHDFNNMLQSIAGGLDLIRRRIAQGRADEAVLYADRASETVERASRLTHHLLAFARRQTLLPRLVEPDKLVQDLAELIQRTVGPGVVVELRLGDGGWCVLCDPGQLESALLNLAINARDAMPEGGQLVIATRDTRLSAADLSDQQGTGQEGAAPGEYVEISVTDSGMGMEPGVLARAFEPFFTTKPLGQGTGLGLSQLYGFVRQSGGIVRLESAPDEGTTVRLYLPQHARVVSEAARGDAEPAAAMAETAPAAEGAASGTVLVVEDEPGVRALIVEALRELGCRVLEAVDGAERLRALQRHGRVDALVTDVGLPGLNGRQLADAARVRDPRLPVLLITGYAGSALEGQLAPGMEVMAKPFALDALAGKIATMLGERAVAPAAS